MGKKEWTQGDRLIPGTNTIIPWPEKADEYHEDFENDTLRLNVDEQTFRPFLLHPPMPLSVIDELRNKFSRFRTRHDWDFIERKELEDEREEKRKDLSDEQLAKIGEVIAAERAKATQTLQG